MKSKILSPLLFATLLSACAGQSSPSGQSSGQPTAQPGIQLSFETKACSQSMNVSQMRVSQERAGTLTQTWVDSTTLRIEGEASANCGVKIKTGRHQLSGKQIKLFYTPEACGVPGGPNCTRCNCNHPVTYTLRNLPRDDYSVTLEQE